MSAGAVVGACLALAGVAIIFGAVMEWLAERANAKRRARRGGYVEFWRRRP